MSRRRSKGLSEVRCRNCKQVTSIVLHRECSCKWCGCLVWSPLSERHENMAGETTRRKKTSGASSDAEKTHKGFQGGLLVSGALVFDGGLLGESEVRFYPSGNQVRVKSNTNDLVFFRNKGDWENFKAFMEACFDNGVQSFQMKAKTTRSTSSKGASAGRKKPKASSSGGAK